MILIGIKILAYFGERVIKLSPTLAHKFITTTFVEKLQQFVFIGTGTNSEILSLFHQTI
jgi:hypothetical protein